MGYLHIENLYKNQDILLFKRCYAMEKIHGTSALISLENEKVGFSSGGEDYDNFVKLFDKEKLLRVFKENFKDKVIIFGEAYGGKQQGMSKTYGKDLKFVVFEVKIGNNWLTVPNAEEVAKLFELDFVDYVEIDTNLESINSERDRESTQAIKNGMGAGKMREGIVLRPLIEVTKNNGDRIIAKHKRTEFKETKTFRNIDNPEELKILENEKEIADEWVTSMRLSHVLDKFTEEKTIENLGKIIKAMQEDIIRESKGEIIISQEVLKQIGRNTAILFKESRGKI